MTTIADSARIIQSGKVKSAKALKALVTITCALVTCPNVVTKDGNFCSVDCLTAHTTPVQVPDHIAPCPDMLTTCIDLECQVRKGIREHLLWNVAHQDRPKASEAALARLNTLLNDGAHGADAPEFFIDHAIAAIGEYGVLAPAQTHVQPAKAVIEPTPTKAVRTPRIAKHQPRTTDSQEHPVTTTYTASQMEAAVKAAVAAEVAKREVVVKATKRTAPADKPVEIVRNAKQGGRAKIQRITADQREFAGLTLDAIVVNEALTIPALEVGEEAIDTLVTPKVRSPYNKARYRLDKEPAPLDKETTTYRVLMAEHTRIAGLVSAKPTTKPAKPAKVVAVAIDTDASAKKAKVKALMTVMGITKAEAKALIG